MGELVGAATTLEKLAVVGALSASFYAGAVVGSLAVATGRFAACGASLADVIQFAVSSNLYRPWLETVLMEWPGITNQNTLDRGMYIYQARLA